MILIESLTEKEAPELGGDEITKEYNIRITQHRSMESFKTMVRRALNVWPDAPVELKEFGDMLLEGHLLQDYKSQNQSMKKFTEKLPPILTDELKRCKDCGGYGYHHVHTCSALKTNKI